MMPVVNVYAEGGAMAEPARHDGEEFVLVVDGTVELTVGTAIPSSSAPATARTTARMYRTRFRNVGTR